MAASSTLYNGSAATRIGSNISTISTYFVSLALGEDVYRLRSVKYGVSPRQEEFACWYVLILYEAGIREDRSNSDSSNTLLKPLCSFQQSLLLKAKLKKSVRHSQPRSMAVTSEFSKMRLARKRALEGSTDQQSAPPPSLWPIIALEIRHSKSTLTIALRRVLSTNKLESQ